MSQDTAIGSELCSWTTYAFHHVDGFTAEMFSCFRAQCRLFSSRLIALQQGWEDLGLDGPKPVYKFEGPTLTADTTTVTFRVGGERSYAAVKSLEDAIPKELWVYFPESFRQGLQYRYAGGWYPISLLIDADRDEAITIAKALGYRRRSLQSFWRRR